MCGIKACDSEDCQSKRRREKNKSKLLTMTATAPEYPNRFARSSSDGDQEERPERMRDWLIRMINSGRFPGLEWLDEEKTIFKVPWIHAKKRGYCKDRDAALFREWAIHSGKYRDEGDPTVWKINFRCAINGLKDILEMKDMQTEDCRVYKVLPSRNRRNQRRPIARSRFPTTEPYCYIRNEVSHSLWSPEGSTYPYISQPPAYPSNVNLEFKPYLPALEAPAVYPSPPPPPPPPSQPAGDCPDEDPYYFRHHSASAPPLVRIPTSSAPFIPIRREDSPDSGYGQSSPAQPFSSDQPLYASSIATSCAYTSAPSCTTLCSITTSDGPIIRSNGAMDQDEEIIKLVGELEDAHPPSTPPSPHPQSLSIRILYGSITVSKKDIVCSEGCRISNGRQYAQCKGDPVELYRLFGPAQAQQITLPPSHPNHIAKEIFDAMTRGLVLEVVDNDIYATALCRTVVYYGYTTREQCFALEKEKRTKVFDYNSWFLPSLEQYASGHGHMPTPHVIFSLGQSWGPQRDAVQNLISIVVTHLQAKHMVDLPHVIARELFIDQPDSIEIDGSTLRDLEAEAFLNQFSS